MNKVQSAKNFLWNAVGTGINCVMSFVYVVVITRLNGIDTAGIFSVCFSVSIILFTFSNLGNRVFEVSDRKTDDRLYFTLKVFACLVSLAFAAVFCLVCKYEKTKFLIVIILTCVRCFESLSDTLYAVFQKNDRLDLVGISYVLKNVLTLSVFIAVDVLSGSILLAGLSMIAVTVLVYLLFDKLLSARYQKITVGETRGMLNLIKAISYFVVFNLIIVVISNVPRLIADIKYSSSQMGFFTVIMMIPTVMAMLGQFVIQPSLNGLTENYAKRDFSAFDKTVKVLFAVLIAAAVVASAAAYFWGPPVLGLIMGLDLKDYALVMVIAIIAGMFNIFTTLISNLLTVMRHTAKQLVFYIATLAFEIVLIYIGVISGSFTNVFLCYLSVMIIQFAIFFVYYLSVHKKECR